MSLTVSAPLPTTPVAYIDQLGIHVPSYQDILTYLQQQYRAIYGSDVYLGNDSQDGQLLAVFALAISDTNAMAAATYAAFSPATAQGAGLSSVVKINGIQRLIPTNSFVDLLLIGQTGTQIINGIVRDNSNNNWLLPALVVIPLSGQIVSTAVAANSGAVQLSALDIDTAHNIGVILTPTRGWQSASNPNAATPGDPLESDVALRQRQTVSTALPSSTVLDGIIGDIASLRGVLRLAAYENDDGVADSNGIPPHSIAMVVDGGDAAEIAAAIAAKKTPGTPTYGTTSEIVVDSYGTQNTIRFFRPTEVTISVLVTVDPFAGYTSSTSEAITLAVVAYIQSLPIGADVLYTKLFSPANLSGAVGNTYNVKSVAISRSGPLVSADIIIAFNEVPKCTTDNVTVTVLIKQ
jgi:uncharacterized phage protein gp47/JayE